MIVSIDFSSAYESLQQRVALFRLLHFSSSDSKPAPPLLNEDSIPLLKSFYLDGLNKVCKRLKSWISTTTISDDSVSIEMPELENEKDTPSMFQSMIADTLKIAVEYHVLSTLYANYDEVLSTQFSNQSDDILNSLLEILALI